MVRVTDGRMMIPEPDSKMLEMKSVCSQNLHCSHDREWACHTKAMRWAKTLFRKYDGKPTNQDHYTVIMPCNQHFYFKKNEFIKPDTPKNIEERMDTEPLTEEMFIEYKKRLEGRPKMSREESNLTKESHESNVNAIEQRESRRQRVIQEDIRGHLSKKDLMQEKFKGSFNQNLEPEDKQKSWEEFTYG